MEQQLSIICVRKNLEREFSKAQSQQQADITVRPIAGATVTAQQVPAGSTTPSNCFQHQVHHLHPHRQPGQAQHLQPLSIPIQSQLQAPHQADPLQLYHQLPAESHLDYLQLPVQLLPKLLLLTSGLRDWSCQHCAGWTRCLLELDQEHLPLLLLLVVLFAAIVLEHLGCVHDEGTALEHWVQAAELGVSWAVMQLV